MLGLPDSLVELQRQSPTTTPVRRGLAQRAGRPGSVSRVSLAPRVGRKVESPATSKAPPAASRVRWPAQSCAARSSLLLRRLWAGLVFDGLCRRPPSGHDHGFRPASRSCSASAASSSRLSSSSVRQRNRVSRGPLPDQPGKLLIGGHRNATIVVPTGRSTFRPSRLQCAKSRGSAPDWRSSQQDVRRWHSALNENIVGDRRAGCSFSGAGGQFDLEVPRHLRSSAARCHGPVSSEHSPTGCW